MEKAKRMLGEIEIFVISGIIALHTRLTHERNQEIDPDINLQVQNGGKLQVYLKLIEWSHGR